MTRGTRTSEEDNARSRSRSLCLRLGAKIFKKEEGSYVEVTECEKWPQGITTAFYGWQETFRRLSECKENPDLVISGIYIPASQSRLNLPIE